MPNALVEWNTGANEDLPVSLKATAFVDRLHQQLLESDCEILSGQLGDAEVLSTDKYCYLDFTRRALPPIFQ